jgi:hypothetical protein
MGGVDKSPFLKVSAEFRETRRVSDHPGRATVTTCPAIRTTRLSWSWIGSATRTTRVFRHPRAGPPSPASRTTRRIRPHFRVVLEDRSFRTSISSPREPDHPARREPGHLFGEPDHPLSGIGWRSCPDRGMIALRSLANGGRGCERRRRETGRPGPYRPW